MQSESTLPRDESGVGRGLIIEWDEPVGRGRRRIGRTCRAVWKVTELSTEEPGYVPPDHETTVEIPLPGKPPAGHPGQAEDTVADHGLPDGRDEAEQTLADPPGPRAGGAAPDATVRDPQDSWAPARHDLPGDSGERNAEAGQGEWTELFGSEDARREAAAPQPSERPAEPAATASLSPLAAAAVPPGATVPDRADASRPEPQPDAPDSTGARPLPPPIASHEQASPAPDAQAPATDTAPAVLPLPDRPVASARPVNAPGAQRPPAGGRRGSRAPLAVAAALVLLFAVVAGVSALTLMRGGKDGEATTAKPPAGGASSAPGEDGSGGTGAPAGEAPPGAGGSGVPAPAQDAPAPGASPQDGAPAPGRAPADPTPPPRDPIGPVLRGKGLTYRLVQHDPGYYEGLLIITNHGAEPMREWTITFETPGADVKHVWGGELVRGGDRVQIRSLDGAPQIPPGGTWEVRFGAAGSPVEPRKCRFNDRECGLE